MSDFEDSLMSSDDFMMVPQAPTPMAYSARGSMVNSQVSAVGGGALLSKFQGFEPQSQPVKPKYPLKVPGDKSETLEPYFRKTKEEPKPSIDLTQLTESPTREQ